MLLRLLLPLTVLPVLCDSRITGQCQCDAYMKCEKAHKPQLSFKVCMRACKKAAGDKVPERYPACLNQFEHLLSNTMKCVHNTVGTGCTSNESNVLRWRNFTVFEEIFKHDFKEIAEKVGVSFKNLTEPAERMNSCLLSCFYPAQNICTMKMKCGLFMPNELRLMDNLSKCALQSDVSKGIMMEMATCLRTVRRKTVVEKESDSSEQSE
ncbi:hypothetical protein GCK32_007631 [Trichostrongylus colubriformis]|uniref:Chondroitin proteoglycan 4 domain-containing protein n=1 Tax=Trichostrongylus colubriformis TaxID=6319 RepID=A0AAN8ILC9_TRICO